MIYKFEWSLVEGKKLQNPLSSLMEIIKRKALNLEFSLMSNEISRMKQKNRNVSNENISLNRINGV